jgi:hypothetical protein
MRERTPCATMSAQHRSRRMSAWVPGRRGGRPPRPRSLTLSCGDGDLRSGIIEEKQKRVFNTAPQCLPVGHGEHGLHLRLVSHPSVAEWTFFDAMARMQPADRLAARDLTSRHAAVPRSPREDRGCSARTRNQRIAAIRAFAHFVRQPGSGSCRMVRLAQFAADE